jgi:hypothetical protein
LPKENLRLNKEEIKGENELGIESNNKAKLVKKAMGDVDNIYSTETNIDEALSSGFDLSSNRFSIKTVN